eukprot:snap_masked-scaffold_7-processed-gene-4.19-mRNA-1 protein AED:1.00 eAED:1.00 QI:0/0/0/0/1/1/2/0/60
MKLSIPNNTPQLSLQTADKLYEYSEYQATHIDTCFILRIKFNFILTTVQSFVNLERHMKE